jgi:signal transduction histidine kinase
MHNGTEHPPIRLLLIEDEQTSAASMAYMLRKRAVDVTLVERATEAIELFNPADFDAVITDIRLPGELAGTDVLDHVRQVDPDFPVILITGFDDINSAIRAVQQRASDYILKPVDEIDNILIPLQKAVAHARLAAENRHLQSKLRQLAAETIMTEESERRRIACDLHDTLGQSLVASSFALQGGLKHGGDRLIEAATQSASSIVTMIEQVRTMTFELSSTALYDLGLGVAVKEYADQTTGPDGPAIKVCCDEAAPQPPEAVRVILYRSIRELIHNAVKHADASLITVTLTSTEEEWRVEVADDGVGFDATAVEQNLSRSGGLGLFSIRERLGQLGGTMQLDSEAAAGSRIHLHVPA